MEIQWWTKKELAQRWKCTVRHVERLIASGRIKARHFGRCVRIGQSEIVNYENGG